MAASGSEVTPLSGIRLAMATMALALANFMVVLDLAIANVSVPHIAGALAVSPTQGTWAITSYTVADAISVPLTGWLAARFGSVRCFMVSLLGFGLFSLLCGLSTSLGMLVAFRIMQGFSGGPLIPLSQTLLLRIFSRDRSSTPMMVWSMTTTVAPVLGPILGGVISDNWSWHWIFLINLPVVVFCLIACWRLLCPFETLRSIQRIDYVGLILMVIFVGSLQLMLDTGREYDWFGSAFIVVLAFIAAIFFVAFLIWELTDSSPIINLRVFRHRSVTVGALVMMLTYGTFFGQVVLTPLWLQQVNGYTATQAGYTVAWIGMFAVMFSPLAAKLVSWVDVRLTIAVGISIMALTALMRAGWTTGVDYWTLAFPQLVQGVGIPFFFIGIMTLALSRVNPDEMVSTAGLISFLRTLSGAIGTALATTSWDNANVTARSEIVSSLARPGVTTGAIEAAGIPAAQSRAVLDRLVETQAATLGIVNIFMAIALIYMLSVALVWFAPRSRNLQAARGGH